MEKLSPISQRARKKVFDHRRTEMGGASAVAKLKKVVGVPHKEL